MASAGATWKPIGIDVLEADAEDAVRANTSQVVIAGPGAGKTELLAQRAAYLLQTGRCKDPHRILALSFKRDAARNLAKRVEARIGRRLASRLDSFTFDAFAKGLVDRFRNALPSQWRPTADYALDFRLPLNTRDAVLSIPEATLSLERWRREALRHGNGEFFRAYVVGHPLPLEPSSDDTDGTVTARALWAHLLRSGEHSVLAFPMLTRLAQLVLKANPMLLALIREVYAFVFLDEFQDTTRPQFALTTTAFAGSSSVITAVGDPKQCVMRWAGAFAQVFDAFKLRFGATNVTLKQNHRSSSALVTVQDALARRIDASAVSAQAVGALANAPAECLLLEFDTQEAEATALAARIDAWIRDENLEPRDICVLTRMQPAIYTAALVHALELVGRRARVEQDLQDLLSEPLVTASIDLLHLAIDERAPITWTRMVDLLQRLDPSLAGGDRAPTHLAREVEALRTAILEEASAAAIIAQIVGVLGEERLRAYEPTYRHGSLFAETRAKLEEALDAAKDGRTWPLAVAELEGTDAIPILTAHKSKGLEYHTVIFVGLEDDAHFGIKKASNEEINVFFVAMSRAQRRLVATFAKRRVTRLNRGLEVQTRNAIKIFYEALEEAGVCPALVGSQ